MNPTLIQKIVKASDKYDYNTIKQSAKEIKHEQSRAGITDSREVINRFEAHCDVKDNSKFALSYSQQRKLDEWSPKDSKRPILTAQRVNE